MWGGFFFDDILRFADYIPVVLSHTIPSQRYSPSYSPGDKNPSSFNTHIRNIHAWFSLLASWRYIYAHLTSPVLIFLSFRISLHLFAPLALDDKYIFIFPLPPMFSVIWFKYIGQAAKKEDNFLYPHYLCTDTHALCMLMIYFEKTTLVSHVLSSSFKNLQNMLFRLSPDTHFFFVLDEEEVLSDFHLLRRWKFKFCNDIEWK